MGRGGQRIWGRIRREKDRADTGACKLGFKEGRDEGEKRQSFTGDQQALLRAVGSLTICRDCVITMKIGATCLRTQQKACQCAG